MKKLLLSFLLMTLVLLGGWGVAKAHVPALASIQGTEVSLQTDTTAAAPVQTDKPFNWKGLIIGIVILCFYAYAIIWIVMTLVKTKKLPNVTREEFINRRKNANKTGEASDEENAKAFELLENIFESWKVISGPGEEELRSPVKMATIKKSRELHAQAEAIMPTDEDVVNRFNDFSNVINAQEKRSFSGSWKLIIIAIISMIIMYFMSKSGDSGLWFFLKRFWFMPLAIILYYFASLAPAFLIDKRSRWFRGKNINNVLIGTIIGLFLATPATDTWVTTWSDGRKTKSEELNPFFFVMLFITFFVVLLLGFLTIVFAGINFLRNYVLYV